MANLKTRMEFAAMLGGAGASDRGMAPQRRTTAVASVDSESGTVTVDFGEGDEVEVPTLAPVEEGEEVIVEIQNGKAVVIGKPGWGDALDAADKSIRADLDVAEDSITALVEATTVSGGSAEEAYSVDIPANAAVLTSQTIYGRYVQEGTPSPSSPAPVSTVAPPCKAAYFTHPSTDSDWWSSVTTSRLEWLDDGWVRVTATKESSGSTVWTNMQPKAQDWVDPTHQYYMLVEYRHLTADGYSSFQNTATNARQLSAATLILVPNEEGASATDESGVAVLPMTYRTTFSGSLLAYTRVGLAGSATSLTVELRVTIYDAYDGTVYLPPDCIGVSLEGEGYEEIIPIDLQGYTLAALPDSTRDVLTVDDAGAVTLTKNVGYRLVDGSDTTSASNGTLKIYRSYLPDTQGYDATHGMSISSHYPTAQVVNASMPDKTCKQATNGIGNPAGHAAYFRDTDLADIAAFRTFIAANPIDFYYKLLDPVTIDLGTVELPELPDIPLTWSIAAEIPASGECEWLTYFGVMSEGEYASKAELAITEGEIMTEVSETYTTKNETQTLSTQVTQNSSDITTLITDVDGIETMIRGYSGGVLVGKPPSSGTSGTSVCALVNANGSFDVVLVTWSRTSTDDPWEPQSVQTPPLNLIDANGMTVSDSGGNEIADFGADGVVFLDGLGTLRSRVAGPLTWLDLFSGDMDTDGAGFSGLSLSSSGHVFLQQRSRSSGVFESSLSFEHNSTVGGYITQLRGRRLRLNAYEVSGSSVVYYPITINGKDLADFPTEYRAASLGEAIPNVSAKPSESARLLGWSYQKYASGLAHMWGVMPFNGSIATAHGAMFMSAADLCSAFPFDVSRILSVNFGQGFASDYTWGLTAYPHLSTAVWQAGNHWGINWRAAAPVSGSYGGYIPIDVWAYVG